MRKLLDAKWNRIVYVELHSDEWEEENSDCWVTTQVIVYKRIKFEAGIVDFFDDSKNVDDKDWWDGVFNAWREFFIWSKERIW